MGKTRDRRSLMRAKAFLFTLFFLLTTLAAAVTRTSSKPAPKRTAPAKSVRTAKSRRPARYVQTWKAPTYGDPTDGDNAAGEDPAIRRAATAALGNLNGSVVVTDAATGRILTIVNQKLAFKSGFTPCSTIKVVAAMGGLMEGNIDRATKIPVGWRSKMDLTYALAHSNNPYFAHVGVQLGFDKVLHYSRLFGLGERAGLDIAAEQPGTLPPAIPREGLGMMTSFGSGINLTPLQLAAALGAIANGGTLYWLQYPRTPDEIENFLPRAKRQLEIGEVLDEIKPGLAGTVEYGTGRRAKYEADESIFGKTGTCTHSDNQTHLGWFGSFHQMGERKLVVVVLLTGGRPVNGPVASGIAGEVYKNLAKTRTLARLQLQTR
ncbi:MAG: penicillin-binding protein [Bryobacteraceae bacterium]|nr:penicillin-binding protein [Bryobacteraceae bacterium]